MANYFPYLFKEKYPSNTCLVKIWFGKKYFIWKAKALRQTAEQVCRDLSRKYRLGCAETDLFYPVVQYIKRGRILSCTFEVILATENHQELVDAETELLNRVFGTPECLNNRSEPYLPNWINLTANKAPQSIISPPDVQSHQEAPVIKPSGKINTSDAKSIASDIGKISSVEKMRLLRAQSGGKV